MMNLGEPGNPHPIDSEHSPEPTEQEAIAEVFAGGGTVEYQEVRVGITQSASPVSPDDSCGRASLARWVQAPEIPICPRTGEPMLFLGEFECELPVQRNDVEDVARVMLDEHSWDFYFSGMLFWGSWPIYVHYHPEGGSLCMHPQGT